MELPDKILSSLETLLEAVSRAVLKKKPEDMAGFLASYFQEFVDFQKANPNLVLTEVVEKLDLKQETWNGKPEEEPSTSNEESCTDSGEDHLEELTLCSSRTTVCPSLISSIPESKHRSGPEGASAPEGSELECVPAQLPAPVEDSSGSVPLVRDVATIVPTLQEDVSAASAAEAAGSQLRVQPWLFMSGEQGPSGSQVLILATDVNQVSSVLLQGQPSSLPPPPPGQEQLQAMPSCSMAEVISTTDKLVTDAEIPSCTLQFPDKIIFSFTGQAPSSIKLSLNAVQDSWLAANNAGFQPEQMEAIAPMESAEQTFCIR
ncbi:UNVERIFIED_CONTAM: hypothetical protein H355_008918 [Colinus virginianus]|nr:hypothetical protein H355_008918 [Colinus virginianus]